LGAFTDTASIASQRVQSHKNGGVSNLPAHGTRARYQPPHRCRCTECVEVNANYQRAYRSARRPKNVKTGSECSGRRTSWHDTMTRGEFDRIRAEAPAPTRGVYSAAPLLD